MNVQKKNPRRFLLPHRALGTRWHRLNKQQKRKTERKQKHGNAAERLPAQPENQLCVHSCMKYGVSCAACRSPRTRSSSLHPTSLTTTQNRYIHRGSSWKKERKKKKKQRLVSVLADVSFFSYCYMFLILFQSRNKNHPISSAAGCGPRFPRRWNIYMITQPLKRQPAG